MRNEHVASPMREIVNAVSQVLESKLLLGERAIRHRMSVESDKTDADLMSEAQEFRTWQEVGGELVRGYPTGYDPTPYCLHCGPKSACDCGPIADNE